MHQLTATLGTTDPKVLTDQQTTARNQFAQVQEEHSQVRGDLRNASARVAAQQGRLQTVANAELPDAELQEYLGLDPGGLRKLTPEWKHCKGESRPMRATLCVRMSRHC